MNAGAHTCRSLTRGAISAMMMRFSGSSAHTKNASIRRLAAGKVAIAPIWPLSLSSSLFLRTLGAEPYTKQTVRTAVRLFTKLNVAFFGYFDPEKIFLDDEIN